MAAKKTSQKKSPTAAKKPKTASLNQDQLNELLYQALETETGGIQIYENAVSCAVNDELKEEWEKYLDQTRNHERILMNLFEKLGLEPDEETPGRAVVRHLGEALVQAMKMAKQAGPAEAAELVAAECVVLAETKDHQNWELLSQVAQNLDGDEASMLQEAVEEVEEEEDEHLYHTQGWSRELWMQSLGLPAVLPPPEEEEDVHTATEADEAKQTRETYL
jgi:rubrerythrin